MADSERNPLEEYESIGVILAGGGAKGAYQAGSLKAIHSFLERHNALGKVRVIAGTSIGSWNAMFWLAGLVNSSGIEGRVDLETWWTRLSIFRLFRLALYFPGLKLDLVEDYLPIIGKTSQSLHLVSVRQQPGAQPPNFLVAST